MEGEREGRGGKGGGGGREEGVGREGGGGRDGRERDGLKRTKAETGII